MNQSNPANRSACRPRKPSKISSVSFYRLLFFARHLLFLSTIYVKIKTTTKYLVLLSLSLSSDELKNIQARIDQDKERGERLVAEGQRLVEESRRRHLEADRKLRLAQEVRDRAFQKEIETAKKKNELQTFILESDDEVADDDDSEHSSGKFIIFSLSLSTENVLNSKCINFLQKIFSLLSK